MHSLTGTSFALILQASLCLLPPHLFAATIPASSQDRATSVTTTWTAPNAEHVYGLPDIKAHKKGVLALSADTLTFTTKSGNLSIPRSSVTAVSAGNQRVEMGGMGGRILRMAIPDGGGLVAASVMHHRVDMLTVEFNDVHGGAHGAVFLLPANEADRALQSFALATVPPQKTPQRTCKTPFDPSSVLVSTPNWDHAEVPAAYRTLVYEHVIDRLQHTKDVGHVYRGGEAPSPVGCPQYGIQIAIATFKEGSSVKRAAMGPVGLFVGTTQMKFDVTFTDATGALNSHEQITATMRGESESTNVADHIAKSLAKHYANTLKNAEKSATTPRL